MQFRFDNRVARRVAGFLALLPAAAFATTSYTVTSTGWDLYQGSTRIQSYSTQAECIAGAEAVPVTVNTSFWCRMRTSIVATVTATTSQTPSPIPAPTPSPSPTPTPAPVPAPTVSLSASPTSVASGATTTLTWSSTNATSCTASGGWSGNVATSGSSPTSALTAGATYTLQCANSAGTTATASTTVSVSIPVSPVGGSGSSSSSSGQALGYYTDLSSAPAGAFVTAYGSGFGTSGSVSLGGAAQKVVSYSDTKVVFTVSGSGGTLMVGGKSLGSLPVHTGRVLQATPSTLASVWGTTQPGDVVYLRAGTYNQVAGEGTWCMDCTLNTFKNGTATQPIALAGYPGETAVMTNLDASIMHSPIALADQNSSGLKANYLTFADFNITGNQTCIDGGGDTSQPTGGPDKTGGANIRVVAIRCEITDTTNNTMTGMIAVQNDGWKILGSTFVNSPNRVIINNNHGIYIQDASSNMEVAYNQLVNLRMGHVIQVHQDGVPKVYTNVWVHDNLLQAANSGDMRGMNVGNVDSSSTITFENNTLRNLGQDFSGIAVYAGVVTIRNNRLYAILASNIDINGQNGGTRKIVATGNRFETVGGYSAVVAENGASLSDITLSGNQYCGQPAASTDLSPAVCIP